MISTGHIDLLIHSEKRAIALYVGWFASAVAIGVGLIFLNFILGWIKGVGPTIGSAFVLMLAKPPLSEVLKRRDRVTALNTVRVWILQAGPDTPEAIHVDAIVWGMLQKMLEG